MMRTMAKDAIARNPRGLRPWVLGLLATLAVAAPLQAQVRVGLEIPRRLYILYEPILVTVTITNLSGRRVVLQDDGPKKWFSFEIMEQDGSPIPPRSENYTLEPLELDAGQTVKRRINLTPLYALQEFGLHRVKALIYFSDLNRFFTSQAERVEITEGSTILEQSVGVPGTRETRNVSLLNFRFTDGNRLYIRILDPESGIVYATAKLGRLLSLGKPQLLFGRENIIHVLQPSAPRAHLYTKMGLDGTVLERETYLVKNEHPRLMKNADGMVFVVGGIPDVPVAEKADRPVPKLSDRPPGLPQP